MDNFATRPSVLNIPALEEEAKEEGVVTEEEKQFFALSKTRGWKQYRDFMGQLMADLDKINTDAIGKGVSLEEIGRNTVVISLVKDILNRTLQKVEDAVEVCEKE